MSLQPRHLRRLALAVLAPLGLGALVRLGGAGAVAPGVGLAWLLWQLESAENQWERGFQSRSSHLRSEALSTTGFFLGITTLGLAAGGGWVVVPVSAALWALSLASVGLEARGLEAVWVVAALAWLGPSLLPDARAFSAPSGPVDDWLPVLGLSVTYVPIVALLIGRSSKP